MTDSLFWLSGPIIYSAENGSGGWTAAPSALFTLMMTVFVVFVLTGTTRARPSTWSPRTTQRSAVSSAQWGPMRWLSLTFDHLTWFIPSCHTLNPRWHCTHQCVYVQWRDAWWGVTCIIQPWLKNSKYSVYCRNAAPTKNCLFIPNKQI